MYHKKNRLRNINCKHVIDGMNKAFMSFVLLLIITACGSSANCDLAYFERITGVKFPKQIEVIECVDNAEFEINALILLPKDSIKGFLNKTNFKPVPSSFDLDYSMMFLLSEENKNYPDWKYLYEFEGSAHENYWTYLLDIQSGRLWCQISYPDWGGT